jgi:hypothetical protein
MPLTLVLNMAGMAGIMVLNKHPMAVLLTKHLRPTIAISHPLHISIPIRPIRPVSLHLLQHPSAAIRRIPLRRALALLLLLLLPLLPLLQAEETPPIGTAIPLSRRRGRNTL